MSGQRYDAAAMTWTQEEELYLHCIQQSSEQLSNTYLNTYRQLRSIQAKIKIPIIIVGSFTGITSFGTDTFPQQAQKWVSIGVGIITIIIAILNTIESYFKIGENANSAINTTNALQQLREDINKELSLPPLDRQAPGLTFLRDCYTRYQQIMSQAPILNDGSVFYVSALSASKLNSIIKKNEAQYVEPETRKSSDKTSKFFGRGNTRMSHEIDSTKSYKPPPNTPSSSTWLDPSIMANLGRSIFTSQFQQPLPQPDVFSIKPESETGKTQGTASLDPIKEEASLTIELSSEAPKDVIGPLPVVDITNVETSLEAEATTVEETVPADPPQEILPPVIEEYPVTDHEISSEPSDTTV